MRPKISERVVTLFIAVGASILVPTVLLGEYSLGATNVYKDWPTFVFNFQSLITGVLAVIAASATITQMRTSDRKSDKRHEQTMALALRGDTLVVERALVPQLAELRKCRVLADLIIRQRSAYERDQGNMMPLHHWRVNVLELHSEVSKVLKREQFLEGRRLFGGSLSHAIGELKDLTDKRAPAMERIASHERNRPHSAEEEFSYERWLDDFGYFVAIGYAEEALKYLSVIPGMLEALGIEYKIFEGSKH